MIDLESLGRLYRRLGASHLDRYCTRRHLIASICMSCGRIYRIVESRDAGGGLSHGWCSDRCTPLATASPPEQGSNHGGNWALKSPE